MAQTTHTGVTGRAGGAAAERPQSGVGRLGPIARLIAWIVLAVAALAVPWVTNDYRTFQFTTLAIFAVTVLGLNMLTGYTGQISLGHAAFVLVGATVAAMLITGHVGGVNVHPIPAVLVGGLVAAAVGVLVGVPALRLAGPYLAVVTLGLTIAMPIILKSKYLDDYTAGAHGILLKKPTPPGVIGDYLFPAEWQYYIALLPAVLMVLMAWNILRSRVGRAFIALRDSEAGAQMAGVNV